MNPTNSPDQVPQPNQVPPMTPDQQVYQPQQVQPQYGAPQQPAAASPYPAQPPTPQPSGVDPYATQVPQLPQAPQPPAGLPGQQYGVVPPAPVQPQQPYMGAQPVQQGYTQQPQSATPAPGYYPTASSASSSNTMGILAIIFAFIFAPVGFVLGILSARKGFKGNANRSLGIMGAVAIGLSSIFTVAFIALVALGAMQAGGSYSKLESRTQKVGDSTVTVKVPAKFEEIKAENVKSMSDGQSYVWGIQAEQSDGQAGALSQLALNSVSHTLSEDQLSAFKEQISSPEGKETMDRLADLYKLNIQGICKDVEMGALAGTEVKGASAALKAEYSCKSMDGTNTAFKGVVVAGLSTKSEVTMVIMVQEDDWIKNKANIDESISSFSFTN